MRWSGRQVWNIGVFLREDTVLSRLYESCHILSLVPWGVGHWKLLSLAKVMLPEYFPHLGFCYHLEETAQGPLSSQEPLITGYLVPTLRLRTEVYLTCSKSPFSLTLAFLVLDAMAIPNLYLHLPRIACSSISYVDVQPQGHQYGRVGSRKKGKHARWQLSKACAQGKRGKRASRERRHLLVHRVGHIYMSSQLRMDHADGDQISCFLFW